MENERKDIKYQVEHGYKLYTLIHYVNKETLKMQHSKQQKSKASGIDRITKEKYGENLDNNIENLLMRMKKFSYKPQPVKRVYIPKSNGKLRPLGIPAYEDRLVQGVMANILSQIYECKFLDCSYGFRPGRRAHQAIAEINHHLMFDRINYVLDGDIKGFFDNVDHEWLMKFLEHDIHDKNFLRYVKRFLISGYMEEMKYHETDKGTPQGGLISPVLANVYLHYVLDLWFQQNKTKLKGNAYLIRFADDFVILLQYEEDAIKVYKAIIERMKKFGLELEQNKTRILPFGRFKGNKESFDFLGFRFINGKDIQGKYRVIVKTSKKKLKQKKENVKKWCKDVMHKDIFETLEHLKLKLIGHYRYYGVSGNYEDILKFKKYVKSTYYKMLRKRGQKHSLLYGKYCMIWNIMKMPEPKIYANIWY